MSDWKKFRGVGTLAPTGGYDGNPNCLDLSRWIELAADKALKIRVADRRVTARKAEV